MKKINPTDEEKYLGLMIYLLFTTADPLDAIQIASRVGIYQYGGADEGSRSDQNVELNSWIELGCKINFSWIEKKSPLSDLTMSQHDFEHLRISNRVAHQKIKLSRDRLSRRWSNSWKIIGPKVLAAQSLLPMTKQNPMALSLTWDSVLKDCARKLLQSNMRNEAEAILLLTIENIMEDVKNKNSSLSG
jgi:hypothetical protein